MDSAREMDYRTTMDTTAGVVNISVGGTKYTISKKTLQNYNKSNLTAWSLREADKQEKDMDGNIFFDRDGDIFKYVLRYMQQRKLNLPKGYKDIDALVEEAKYYNVEGLPEALEKYKKKNETVLVLGVLGYECHLYCTLETYKSLEFLKIITAKEGYYTYAGRTYQVEDFWVHKDNTEGKGIVDIKVTVRSPEFFMTLAIEGFETKGQFNGFTLFKQ